MRTKQTMNAGSTDRNRFTQIRGMVFEIPAGRTEGPACITRKRLELTEEGNDSLAGFCQQFWLRSGSDSIGNRILVGKASHPPVYGL